LREVLYHKSSTPLWKKNNDMDIMSSRCGDLVTCRGASLVVDKRRRY
jgi:hypothetical protein